MKARPALLDDLPRGQSLARYTAARLGGPADCLHIARHADFADTLAILREAWRRNMPVSVLGGGANVLVSDAGIRGLTVINRATDISHVMQGERATLSVASGTNLIRLARYCQEHGLAGLAWAIAVPGSLGGAVINNAGAHGGDMASVLKRARIVDAKAGEIWLDAADLAYDYRYSSLKHGERRYLLTRAELELERDEPRAIQARMDRFSQARKQTQPAGASLGSIFKNPPGDYAGRLIDAAGLKGLRIGAVRVSPVHANFFVNMGEAATASDYLRLIRQVRARVMAAFGIALELEIQLLGEWRESGAESPARSMASK